MFFCKCPSVFPPEVLNINQPLGLETLEKQDVKCYIAFFEDLLFIVSVITNPPHPGFPMGFT